MSVRPLVPDDRLLPSAIALGDENKATLGLIPRAVYRQRAEAGTLLAAVSATGELVGYAMYEVARSRVRLVHLCVREADRGRGAARALVDHISSTHPELNGIKVKCRADYPAAGAWPRLGFSLRNEVSGRGKDKHPLQVWWRDHGVPDLFSVDADEDLITVAIDHMIFLDLALERIGPGAAESQVLAADWVADRIHVCLTPETLNEISRLEGAADRQRERGLAAGFSELTVSPAAVAASRKQLLEHLAPGALSESDLNHVVYAAAAGAAVFVTRDHQLLTTAAEIAESVLGVRILLPTDVAVLLDQLADADRYRPAALRGTGYSVQDIPPGAEGDLEHLLLTATGERRSEWRSRLRRLAADPSTTCQWIRDGTGRVVAAWAVQPCTSEDTLVVAVLRAAATPLSSTLLRLLLFQIKHVAVQAGLSRVAVEGPHISDLVRRSLEQDAFELCGHSWQARVVDARTLADAGRALHDQPGRAAEVRQARAPGAAAAFERQLWPLKLLDSSMPSYIIAIQPRWAKELFSLEDTLFQRADALGMSREHVYYRVPRGNPRAPGRVLWYASGSGSDRIGAVVACSQLTEVVVDHPGRLYRRFRHLGVYQRDHVDSAARSGLAAAVRFVDTELLPFPVPLDRVRALATAQERPIGLLQSPTLITGELFGAVYQEGTGRRGR